MPRALVVLNGASSGRAIRLEPQMSPLSIGRHESRDVCLDDDLVSRLHARIVFRAGRWCVEDCSSLNGTFVNSQRVQQLVLEPGDLIRIGERLILFVEEDCSAAALTPWQSSHPTVEMSAGQDTRPELVEKSVSAAISHSLHDSTILCNMANMLQQQVEIAALPGVAMQALRDGITPDSVSLWLVRADGRLHCAKRYGEKHAGHLLASIAIERNKAILIDQEDGAATGLDAKSTVGRSMGVPIPGKPTCCGAIECHRRPEHTAFGQSDLDFVAVVAHQFGSSLENLEHRERLERANEQLRCQLLAQSKLEGSSYAMKDVLERIARVASTSSIALITGESGTGKELAARQIHDASDRSAGPFVTVSCAAFTDSLLESELFGHEAGAFTGADQRQIGLFERAHRGTILLDDIGEMSPACQAKLLRVLDGHSFQRLGGVDPIRADVRILAATTSDLLDLVRQDRFREDLYYRLCVVDIHMPPLRERGEDVIELATSFLEQFRRQMGYGPRRFSDAAIAALRGHHWPGNVRELRNAVERAMVVGTSDQVSPEDLGLAKAPWMGSPQARPVSLQEAERRHIGYVLGKVGGNKSQACAILGITCDELERKLKEHGIAESRYVPE